MDLFGNIYNAVCNLVDALAVEAKKGHTRYDVYIDDGSAWVGADAVKWNGKEWVPIEVGVK